MKTILLLLAVVTMSLARPQFQKLVESRNSRITEYISEITDKGYKFSIKQDDGQSKEEMAEVINQGKENEFLTVRGSYYYIGDDGKIYSVHYTADENGFHPEGEHIPLGTSGKRPPTLSTSPAALASLVGIGK